MKHALAIAAREPRARRFLLVCAQSSLGTGAAAVALVVLAYQRLHSPWAIALVLLADFAPGMFAGPLLGAAVDRWSRRGCAVIADVLRAAAFVSLAFVHSIEATVALALVAGAGNALFSPAVLAALPGMVDRPERRAAATSLYGVIRQLGYTLGPLIAAVAFSAAGPAWVMAANGATFAVSAAVLVLLPFGPRVSAPAADRPTGALRMPGVRVVLWASSAIIVFAGLLNVGEVILARELGAGASGLGLLMAAMGCGIVAGSLAGAGGAPLHAMKSRYLLGLLLVAAGLGGIAVSHAVGVALFAFFVTGLGNGLVIVHERLIIQTVVPDRVRGRAFAMLETLEGWGFAIAFVGAGAIVSSVGTRAMLTLAATGALLVCAAAAAGMRRVWTPLVAGGDPEDGMPGRYAADVLV